jgi:hypothetical protein
MKYQRVYVMSVEGCPSFLVPAESSDKFIVDAIRRTYGEEHQHNWEAFDEEDVQREFSQRVQIEVT